MNLARCTAGDSTCVYSVVIYRTYEREMTSMLTRLADIVNDDNTDSKIKVLSAQLGTLKSVQKGKASYVSNECTKEPRDREYSTDSTRQQG